MKKSDLQKIIKEELKRVLKEAPLFNTGIVGNDEADGFTIREFNDAFVNFYDSIDEFKNYLDSDTKLALKKALEYLDRAWENEAISHGTEWAQYDIKL